MVAKIEAILNELRDETPATRRLLERVPDDKLTWKPHPKSRSLGELANHIASLPGMVERVAKHEEFSVGATPPAAAITGAEIRANFEKNVRTAEDLLAKMTEQEAAADWRLVFKGKEIFRRPRAEVLRTNVLNHLYHHRGQMSVYLRLLDVPVPVVYGPTADENPFA
jgi:uncharacterized damage-inducible protein DinB